MANTYPPLPPPAGTEGLSAEEQQQYAQAQMEAAFYDTTSPASSQVPLPYKVPSIDEVLAAGNVTQRALTVGGITLTPFGEKSRLTMQSQNLAQYEISVTNAGSIAVVAAS